MHPVGSFLVGVIAMLAYAVDGPIGSWGLYGLYWLCFLLAQLPVAATRDHPVGAWVFAPYSRKPSIISKRLQAVLDESEIAAILAHEQYHLTFVDRFRRFAAAFLGASTPTGLAAWLLRHGYEATSGRLALIACTAAVSAFIHARLLVWSERKADAMAISECGAEALQRAHAKLQRTNRETWGMSPEEASVTINVLYAQYLADFGGASAVLRPWTAFPNLGIEAIAEMTANEVQLSLVGQQIFALVDGVRTVEQICAEMEQKLSAFEVCRVLKQLKDGGLVRA